VETDVDWGWLEGNVTQGRWEEVIRRLHSWACLTHHTSAISNSKAVGTAVLTPS